MWLLPVISRVSSAAIGGFYRVETWGDAVPADGPVLLVANHPNSLIDPAAVAASAGRSVRFLAKAPLFTDAAVGWLIRASGAIPVYRRADDPNLVDRNDQTFRAAHEALARGDAVGIFPEGLSHSEPELVQLRTGAARIALGAASLRGGAFPIIPVGLSFPEKTRFRSDALIIRGGPIAWDDLRGGETDREAVRELTARIDRALREVTVNLESWEDAPLVEAAEEIYAAELPRVASPGAARGAGMRVTRIAELSGALRQLRSGERGDWEDLAADVKRHDMLLTRLGIRPHQLSSPRLAETAAWLPRHLTRLALLSVPALVGTAAYCLPYRLTGAIASRGSLPEDVRATHKLLIGAALHAVTTIALAAAVGSASRPAAGLLVLVLLPACGAAALAFSERVRLARGEAHRFLVRARRAERVSELRTRQAELAARMEAVRAELERERAPG